jgi:hypothetical protein
MDESITLLDEQQDVDKFANVAALMDSHWERHGHGFTSDVNGESFQTRVEVISYFHASNSFAPPAVHLSADVASFSFGARFDPEQARIVAHALLKAADAVEPLRLQWKSIVQGVESCTSL